MRLLTAGESHGPELTVIIDGVPAGLEINADEIDLHLRRRQGGFGRGARSTRIEQDTALITGGLADVRKRQSVTTGAPVSMRIVNRDFDNQPAVAKRLSAPRPGHADMAGGI